jgi:predicted DNA-binding transcriptional regulator YafY
VSIVTTSTATTVRLLALLSLLQTPREWPGPLLADRLGVDQRTVRRDVERLRELGYTIRADRGSTGGYRLDAGAQLPPLLLDDEQVTAVAIALQGVPQLGTATDEAAARALETIRRVLPPRLRRRADAVRFETADRPRSAQGVSTEVLLTLAAAVRAREVLRIDYGEPDAETAPAPPRRVEPHHLVAAGGRWYLVAWDLTREDWRTLRVDRLTPRTPSGPRFTPRALPGGDVTRFLAGRFKGSSDGESWPCQGSVELGLPAREVARFADDGIVEDLGGDRCRLQSGAWSWMALAAHLARFDAVLRDPQPADLAAAFAVLARRAGDAASATRPPGKADGSRQADR